MIIKRVYKYPLPIRDQVYVRMPINAEIFHIHPQDNDLCIWAAVDPDEKQTVDRCFRIAGTGHEIEYYERMAYLTTVHLDYGSLVFHVFERLH